MHGVISACERDDGNCCGIRSSVSDVAGGSLLSDHLKEKYMMKLALL